MPLRKLFLRVMLYSLICAAVGGVMAVLFSSEDVVWRVVGSMFLTAVASGLMMFASTISEREKTRAAGLLAMGLITLEYIAALALIWEIPEFLGGSWQATERLGIGMGSAALTGLLAIASLVLYQHPTTRLAGRFGVLLAIITTALWLVGLLVYHIPNNLDEHLLGSALTIGICGLGTLLLLLDFSPRRFWIYPGLLSAVITTVLILISVWTRIESHSGIAGCIASLAVFTVYTNIIRLIPLKPEQR